MRYFSLTLLLILPLSLAPAVALAAGAKPKPAAAGRPTGGDQAPADPKADGDAEKADPDKAATDKADADQPKRRKISSRPTSMDVISLPGGLKTVNIHFRWSLYPNASIEVRLVPGANPKGITVSPIYFREHLKGPVLDALYTCLDHPGEGGRTHSFTKDKIVYKMIGRRNSLGSQGVHVSVLPEDADTLQRSPPKAPPPGARVGTLPRLGDSDNQQVNPAAAFLQLDTWAVNPETLSLDLARDEFAQSGTLFVWFFRGDQVVWEEQIRWPGYK